MKKNILFLWTTFSVVTSIAQLKEANVPSGSALGKVKTAEGIVEGKTEKTGVVSFKGIPYAVAPIGKLRWKAPQPIKPWNGTKKCEAFGPNAMQRAPEPFYMWSEEFLIPKNSPINEDCLYLNVWTTAKSPQEKKPVLVWIHGGGFTGGGGSVPIYDGEAMAQKGIVYITINYRLGVFGFLAHPELTQESNSKASGNYGLMDQIAALHWVKRNIASFGGDPNNITIAGQSAGSMSVVYLMASPMTKGLFQKAIAQSGAGLLSMTGGLRKRALPDLKTAESDGQHVLEELKVASISQLRNIPAAELQNAVFRSYPIVDGYVIPESVARIFEQNKENNVALLTGWNEDEGIVIGPLKSAAEFVQDVEKQFGDFGKELLKYYPANEKDAATSQMKLARDMVFGAQNYRLANLTSGQGKHVFVYRFMRKVPATGDYLRFGAFHTGEVPYTCDNLRFVNRPWQSIDHQLAKTMSAYWINFIITGNPNGTGLPTWPQYDVASKEIMIFGEDNVANQIPDATSLDFLCERLAEN
jgi:para-nitrobenzyl esterase